MYENQGKDVRYRRCVISEVDCLTHIAHVALQLRDTLVIRGIQHHGVVGVVLLGLKLIIFLKRSRKKNKSSERSKTGYAKSEESFSKTFERVNGARSSYP